MIFDIDLNGVGLSDLKALNFMIYTAQVTIEIKRIEFKVPV